MFVRLGVMTRWSDDGERIPNFAFADGYTRLDDATT